MEEEQISFISNKFKEENKNAFLFSRIVETEEEVRKFKENNSNYFEKIHCNGCYARCSLSSPNCGRGMGTRKKIEELLK